jgi:hypothetical protein
MNGSGLAPYVKTSAQVLPPAPCHQMLTTFLPPILLEGLHLCCMLLLQTARLSRMLRLSCVHLLHQLIYLRHVLELQVAQLCRVLCFFFCVFLHYYILLPDLPCLLKSQCCHA